jgi:lysophospholipase L1-like esterase
MKTGNMVQSGLMIFIFGLFFVGRVTAADTPSASTDMKIVRETTEWCDMRVHEATKNDLPRVLLIGDSISGGYFQGVINELKDKAYVARLGTSKSLGDPALFDEIKLMLGQYKFAVIHFNNGLHGWGYTEDDYHAAFPKLIALLKEKAPGAKLIWATTTTVRTGKPKFEQLAPQNERVKVRNRIAGEIVTKEGIPINDLYALEENHPEHSSDGVHFKSEAAAVQAKQVAKYIIEALSK